eukprot:6457894-Prymnesium_polylepis.1
MHSSATARARLASRIGSVQADRAGLSKRASSDAARPSWTRLTLCSARQVAPCTQGTLGTVERSRAPKWTVLAKAACHWNTGCKGAVVAHRACRRGSNPCLSGQVAAPNVIVRPLHSCSIPSGVHKYEHCGPDWSLLLFDSPTTPGGQPNG